MSQLVYRKRGSWRKDYANCLKGKRSWPVNVQELIGYEKVIETPPSFTLEHQQEGEQIGSDIYKMLMARSVRTPNKSKAWFETSM
jgi:hypothetical protein